MNRNLTDSDADSYAVQFARKGGLARGKKLSKARLSEIATKAAAARWATPERLKKKRKGR